MSIIRCLWPFFSRRGFATQTKAKPSSSKGKLFIKNNNLQFQDSNYHLQLYLFYPTLTAKGTKTYFVKAESQVLALSFTPKHQSTNTPKSQKYSLSLKYSQLGQLLQIHPGSEADTTIIKQKIAEKNKVWQVLQIKDSPSDTAINLTLKQCSSNKADVIAQTPAIVSFNLSYMHARVMHLLLQNSLFDLSGQKIMYDIKRLQELETICIQEKEQNNLIQNEINQFYKSK